MKQRKQQQQRRKRRERKRITSLHFDDLNVDDGECDAPFKQQQQQQPSKGQDESMHSGSPPPHHSLLLFTLVCRPQIRFFEQQRQEHKLGVVLVAISVLFICCHAPSVRYFTQPDGSLLAISVQRSAKVGAPGLVNFIAVVAYHFCLNLPAASQILVHRL